MSGIFFVTQRSQSPSQRLWYWRHAQFVSVKQVGPRLSQFEVSIPHLIRHTNAPGRAPLKGWLDRCSGRYLPNEHKRRRSMPSAGFESAIQSIGQPQTYNLDPKAIPNWHHTHLGPVTVCEQEFLLYMATNNGGQKVALNRGLKFCTLVKKKVPKF